MHYTTGKPVRGTVYYEFGIENPETKRYEMKGSSGTVCFDNGANNFTLPVSDTLSGLLTRNSHKRRVRVQATVRECASGAIEKAVNDKLIVVKKAYSISWQKTARSYKPNVANFIIVSNSMICF